jgi:YVTN family beta-propeller protein
VHLATNTTAKRISFGNAFPNDMEVNSAGTKIYVTSEVGVTPISVATNTAGNPVRAGDHPWTIAINAAGTRAYVTDIGAPNAPAHTVSLLNLTTRTRIKTITVGLRPLAVVLAG